MSRSLYAHLALFTANLLYGVNYSIAKMVLGEWIQPFGFILLRVSGTVILIWLTALAFVREKVEKGDYLLLFFCGLFGVSINQLLFFWGLSLTSPINSSIIMVTNPILVLVIASWWLKERINSVKIAGILTGLSGAVILLLIRNSSSATADLTGDIMIFFNSLSYAVYLVIVKPLMRKYHPFTVMKWVFLFGLIPVIPVGWSQLAAVDWNSFTPLVWYAVVFVVIGSTYLAYLLNIVGLRSLSPAIVSSYIYMQPAVATLVAILLGHDHPDWIRAFSAALIFTGVYLVTLGGSVDPSGNDR